VKNQKEGAMSRILQCLWGAVTVRVGNGRDHGPNGICPDGVCPVSLCPDGVCPFFSFHLYSLPIDALHNWTQENW